MPKVHNKDLLVIEDYGIVNNHRIDEKDAVSP
jgi:hypothetical protein